MLVECHWLCIAANVGLVLSLPYIWRRRLLDGLAFWWREMTIEPSLTVVIANNNRPLISCLSALTLFPTTDSELLRPRSPPPKNVRETFRKPAIYGLIMTLPSL